MKVLEIVCLENGDVVLVEAPSDANGDVVLDSLEIGDGNTEQAQGQPLVSIRFSPEVRDMLGEDAFGVAEAMIEAATAYISDGAEAEGGHFDVEYGVEYGVEFVRSGEVELSSERIDPDLEDFEDQVSTTPVVLH